MRPIVWGFILTVTTAFFWVIFNKKDERAMLVMLFSLPITFIIEIGLWVKRRKRMERRRKSTR